MFSYLLDKEGHIVFIIRVRLNIKDSAVPKNALTTDILHKFFVYLLEKAINSKPGHKVAIIFDFQKASIMNADIKMAHNISKILLNYYYGKNWFSIFVNLI